MSLNTPKLTSDFADNFPGLCLPWQSSGVNEAELVWLNEDLAESLDLSAQWLRSGVGIDWLVGEKPAKGSRPVAQVYAGHQFGFYSPRLGDGRALLLGELQDTNGKMFDIHLKGSGPTPFARGGDGFAPLDAMLREAVMGEAMHALGVKTTRILAVVKTGRWIARDGEPHPAAIAVRVARSHIRVGTFQFVRRTGDEEELLRLTEYSLRRHYPKRFYALADAPAQESVAAELLEAVIKAQAKLVASWMLVGFVHGVINTDNVTISGETLDYGPCAMMEYFNAATVFSSIDSGGRYAYQNQPGVMQWNTARFSEALLPFLANDQDAAIAVAEEKVQNFKTLYEKYYEKGLQKKLAGADRSVLKTLEQEKPDFTTFFRELSNKNPLYIPRNHLVAEALVQAEDGQMEEFEKLVDLVSNPYEKRAGFEDYEKPAPPESDRFITTCGT